MIRKRTSAGLAAARAEGRVGGRRKKLDPANLLPHVAPLGWEHIALTGDYVWSEVTPQAEFRSLRDVRAEALPGATG
jgi:hypothetical protein